MKLYCNICEKEVIPKDGKCPKCGMEFDPTISEEVKQVTKESDKNIIARILKISGIVILVVAFIYGIILGQNMHEYGMYKFNYTAMIICWISGGICSLLFFTGAEGLQILHDIRKRIYRKK